MSGLGRKRTWQPKRRRHMRVHGFRKRMSTLDGRNVLRRRREKGRHQLTVTVPQRAAFRNSANKR